MSKNMFSKLRILKVNVDYFIVHPHTGQIHVEGQLLRGEGFLKKGEYVKVCLWPKKFDSSTIKTENVDLYKLCKAKDIVFEVERQSCALSDQQNFIVNYFEAKSVISYTEVTGKDQVCASVAFENEIGKDVVKLNNQIVIFRRHKNKIEVIGQALPHVPSNKSIVEDLETFKIEFEPDCPGLNFESLYSAKYLIIEIDPSFRLETLRLPPFFSNKLHKVFSAKSVFNLYEN